MDTVEVGGPPVKEGGGGDESVLDGAGLDVALGGGGSAAAAGVAGALYYIPIVLVRETN